MSSPIRNRELFVSEPVFRGLRTAAEWNGLTSPDQLADLWLSERLNSDPDLTALSDEISAACKTIYRKYHDRKAQQTTL